MVDGSAGVVHAVDVCVVGAGPWGLAAAWRLARAGAAVAVCDDGAPPAAEVAAGMLGPWSEADEADGVLGALMRAAARDWPAFAADVAADGGGPSAHHPTGTLMVAARPEHRGTVAHLAAVLARIGEAGAARPLTAGDLRGREPGLGPAVTGGLHLPGEHTADPRVLMAGLRAALARRGVPVLGAAVSLVRARDGRVDGVVTASGTVRAGRVVLAAGWASSRLHPRVPVRGVTGEVLILRPRPGAPAPLGTVVRTPDVYLVPRPDGRVVVGATQEEREDAQPTAGGAHDLLVEALHTVPALRETVLAEHRAGRRPATPDGRPAVGDGGDRVVWAAGGFRHGVLLAPVVAVAVERAARGAPPGAGWEALGPDRFTEGDGCV